MVVHYTRTVCKNSYAEHEVTGKTYKYSQHKSISKSETNSSKKLSMQ